MQFITIEDNGLSSSGKTRTWIVSSKQGGKIGGIAWYGPWRKYVFEPYEFTIFEWHCLRDIADFLEEKTREHRAKKEEPANGMV